MDVPALPPSQGNVPAIVANATELPTPVLTTLTPSTDQTATPAGFLASSRLAHSFSFVDRVLRSANLGRTEHDPYSATVPIQQAQRSSWHPAVPVDIQVKRVEAAPQQAMADNADWAGAFTGQCSPVAQRQLQAGPSYQISLDGQTLGYVAGEGHAYLLAQQLKRLLRQASFNPEAIAPSPIASHTDESDQGARPALMIGADGQQLLTINLSLAESVGYDPEWAAVAWANNLRLALDAQPLSPLEAQMSLKNLRASEVSMTGEASWYGPYFHGRTTANGETFNQNDLTVAHKSLPFGTQLKVRNLLNDKTVVVRVNDRGPYVGDRSLDLSKAAARCLGSEQVGIIPYEAIILKETKPLALAARS